MGKKKRLERRLKAQSKNFFSSRGLLYRKNFRRAEKSLQGVMIMTWEKFFLNSFAALVITGLTVLNGVAYAASNDDEALAHFENGFNHSEQGQLEQAIADYDKAIELKPDFVAAYYNRGVSYLKQNEFKKALEDFDKYIQFVPNDPDGYQMRGKCYEALGDTAKAQADLDKAKELAKNG